MQAAGCTGLDALNPVCQIGSLGGSLATSGFESVLNGISQWVASGAEYLLGQIGTVLVSTTTIDVGATWFRTHYGQMTALAGVVILPMLLVSTLQAVLRQNPGQLVRTYLVQLPLALLLAVVAIQVVILSLAATDAMSDAIAGGTGADVTSLLSTVTKGLVLAASDPSIAGERTIKGKPTCTGKAVMATFSAMLLAKRLSSACPKTERPSGNCTPLIRNCTLACSPRTWIWPKLSCATPGICSRTWFKGAFSPCGMVCSASGLKL